MFWSDVDVVKDHKKLSSPGLCALFIDQRVGPRSLVSQARRGDRCASTDENHRAGGGRRVANVPNPAFQLSVPTKDIRAISVFSNSLIRCRDDTLSAIVCAATDAALG